MSRSLAGRRAVAILTAAFAVLAAATAHAQGSAPTQSAAAEARRCPMGQPQLQPLQPLAIATAKGRFAFKVEDADTYEKREIGLMCRTALGPSDGMLFDFLKPTDDIAFWMRNTLIPLDIVFIAPDGRVVSIAHGKPLDDTPLPAGGRIRGVLEIAGGRAEQLGLKAGDRVSHKIFAR